MRLLLLFVCLLLSCFAYAQTNISDTASDEDLNQVTVPASYGEQFTPVPAPVTDSATTAMNYEVFRYTFTQNRKVFEWQYISSIIIFFMVMLIVLTGLYLSYLQFRIATRLLLTPPVAGVARDDSKSIDMMKADLAVGKDGIKINTAVIGLIILTLSLSFLFLYLKYVYPISIVKVV